MFGGLGKQATKSRESIHKEMFKVAVCEGGSSSRRHRSSSSRRSEVEALVVVVVGVVVVVVVSAMSGPSLRVVL